MSPELKRRLQSERARQSGAAKRSATLMPCKSVRGESKSTCQCWNRSCRTCMRRWQARRDALTRMIAMGWGDTPAPEIPKNWRQEFGPDVESIVHYMQKPIPLEIAWLGCC